MSGKVAKRQRAAEAWGPWVDVHDAVLVARSGQAGETLINMVRAVRNQILSVQILAYSPHPDGMLYGHEVFHLMIRRHDGAPGIGWKEKQRIKDELMGPGWTAVEVFPPRSKLVDSCNLYHLWAFNGPALGFGLHSGGRFQPV